MVRSSTPSTNAAGFELSISAREDGTLDAAYLRVTDAPVARTEEIIEETLLADYDAKGRLVGVEILGPVQMADLTGLVERTRRTPFKRFVEMSAPRQLVKP